MVNLRHVLTGDNSLLQLPSGSSNNYYQLKGFHAHLFGSVFNFLGYVSH